MDRRTLLAARLAWRFPALLNLPLVGLPLDRYGDRYAAVPRHTVPPSAAGWSPLGYPPGW